MNNSDTNLFTEKELTTEIQGLKAVFFKIQEYTTNILKKEKELNYPIEYDFGSHEINLYDDYVGNRLYSESRLTKVLMQLVGASYLHYFKIEINNKIKAGSLSFDDGYKAYVKYDENLRNMQILQDEKSMSEKIKNKRDHLTAVGGFNSQTIEQKGEMVKNFWENRIYENFLAEFPIFEQFLKNIKLAITKEDVATYEKLYKIKFLIPIKNY